MIIDLSHPIETGMPVYPGTDPPVLERAADYHEAGFREHRLHLSSHAGTHIDCPAHLYPEGLTVEQMPLAQFYGPGLVLDCRELGKEPVDAGFIHRFEKSMVNKEFILFYTGWDQKWGSPHYFTSYPAFTAGAVQALAGMEIKGIGIDAVSIDSVEAVEFTNHQIFLQKPRIIIENLTGLHQLTGRDFIFMCLPLKIKNGDGSPVRAAAVLG